MLGRRAFVGIACALVALSSCVPPLEEATTPVHFDPETVMGQIQARGYLRIGIATDRPPLGSAAGESQTRAAGLTPDLGRYVAAALHVTPRFVLAPNDELLGMIDDKSVDVAFPVSTITESLVRHYSFTDPYWVAHQRVLGFDGAYDPADLAGEKVCSFVDPKTEVALDELDPAVDVQEVAAPSDCVPLLRRGVPATAADVVLMGMLSALDETPRRGRPAIGGDDLTTEGYGAVVVGDAPGFIEVVDNVLARAKDDGTWQDAVDRWIDGTEPSTTPIAPPDLTVEEAAALYPTAG